MAIFKPIDEMSEAYVRFGCATEYDKRANSHFLIVWFGLKYGLLFDTEHSFGGRVAIFVRGYALIDTTVGHCWAAKKKCAVRFDCEATTSN